MTEDPLKSEVGSDEGVLPVTLGGGRVGHEIKKPGATFRLSNMFSDSAKMLGGDKFTEVYFRTVSGNIYRLDDWGRLINANESKRQKHIVVTELPTEELTARGLTIGEAFSYGEGGTTTSITEIVPTNERVYTQDYTARIGRSNTIVEDFRQGLPPIPANLRT